MSKEVAVVILNWNGIGHLKEFLPSVVKNTSDELAEIVVVDNASTDESVAYLKTAYPRITTIINPQNGGFAKGYNDGLKFVEAKYYVLLNSDVEVTPGWIEPLYHKMESSSRIAACQPKVLDYKNKVCFEHAGAAGGYIDQFGYPFCRGRLFHHIEEDSGQYNDDVEIFWATGACMMIRAELFHKLGGFDETFFAHMEEIDLCWRLKNRGYQIHYVHHAKVFHLGGGTLSVISPNKTYLNFRNNLYLLYKNLPDQFLFKTIFARMLLDGLAFFHFVLGGKLKHAQAIWRAHIDFYRNLKSLKASRADNKQYLQIKYLSGVYKGALVWQCYIKAKKIFSQLDLKSFEK
ncbi:MAG: glycosyltransferase family 2 protein [Bacteroidota bacterium]